MQGVGEVNKSKFEVYKPLKKPLEIETSEKKPKRKDKRAKSVAKKMGLMK